VRVQFDDLTFDDDTRQLWVRGEEIRLSPKAFDLLALLIARRPSAVSKTDIHGQLWPRTFVSESSLPSLVSEIRDAIGDNRRKPGFVRTVHRFGYAFQAESASRPYVSASGISGPNAWLISRTAEVALLPGENILGREGDGIILVESGTVSRRHARIVVDPKGASIEDLKSKNGTFVNDRRVSAPTPVTEGDQVRIGSLLFTFRRSQGSQSTETQSRTAAKRLHP
jgi:DNA-binding winged helix-turn-helix (wHTH) protein